ncbi:MAG: DASS family sodium-coupled anion symporter [Phycisphaerae bacterium]|nr:DASS family sodium-coupled anion symporter [Phycisphaerae bacterium]
MNPPPQNTPRGASRGTAQRAGLVLGLAGMVVLVALPTFDTFVEHTAVSINLPANHADVVEVARGMQMTLAVMVIMVLWWVTEAVPIPITALLPGLLFPLLHVTGTLGNGHLYPFDAKAAFASFASPVIYLFLAGFLLAGAMRKTGLDRRITLGILSWKPIMHGPGTILIGVMAITAFLSMWISNTATTAMMLPIALTILSQLGQQPGESPFGSALMLGIAWSASIGGIATIIGSPPNGIVVGILHEQGVADINFLQWMKIGGPVTIVCLAAAWVLLMLIHRPSLGDTSAGLAAVRQARSRLGRLSTDETATLIAFAVVVLLWVTHAFWDKLLPEALYARVERFDIYEIGLLGAVLLFIVPVGRDWRTVLDWRDAKYVEWGTLILFGGGIALSNAMFKTGLTNWLAETFVAWIGRPGPWISLALIVLLVDYLTEITSNTAVTSMMTPVLVGLAVPLGLPPVTLCVAAAMASSLAFMLPVATPPNALVYGSGYFRIAQMARAGFLMNLLGCAVMVACLYYIAGRLFAAIPIN